MSVRLQSFVSVSTIKVIKALIEVEVLVEVPVEVPNVSVLSKMVIMSEVGIQSVSTIEIHRTLT
jgi:hypothetical protein